MADRRHQAIVRLVEANAAEQKSLVAQIGAMIRRLVGLFRAGGSSDKRLRDGLVDIGYQGTRAAAVKASANKTLVLDQMGLPAAPRPKLNDLAPRKRTVDEVVDYALLGLDEDVAAGRAADAADAAARAAEKAAQDAEWERFCAEVEDGFGDAMHDVALQAANATVGRGAKIIGWRRIIHPELPSESGVCGLCIAAAGRLYTKPDLLPLHDRCRCGVIEVTALTDPGLQMNADDLYTQVAIKGAKGIIANPAARKSTKKKSPTDRGVLSHVRYKPPIP